MVPDFKNILFPIIEGFKTDGGLEWTEALKDLDQEDLLDTLEIVHDTVKNVIYHAALLPGIDDDQREKLIGKLAIRAAKLFHTPGRFNQAQLEESVRLFEDALRNIALDEWISLARERFDEFEKMYETAEEEGEISPEQVDHLRPVFFILDLFEILTFDPSQENEEEEMFELDIDEDDDEDFEDEEE